MIFLYIGYYFKYLNNWFLPRNICITSKMYAMGPFLINKLKRSWWQTNTQEKLLIQV